jgi:hypothetical protein
MIKDPFYLTFVDLVFDKIASHRMQSFMDGYNGYNQIRMVDFYFLNCNLWMEENVYEQSTNVDCTKLD